MPWRATAAFLMALALISSACSGTDGDTDLLLPRIGKPNGLYINDGSGAFVDEGVAAGIGGPDDRFGA